MALLDSACRAISLPGPQVIDLVSSSDCAAIVRCVAASTEPLRSRRKSRNRQRSVRLPTTDVAPVVQLEIRFNHAKHATSA